MSAVYRTGGRATLRQCALILRGSQAQEVVEPGWHDLKTSGAGRELKFEEWMEYGSQMVNAGYWGVADGEGDPDVFDCLKVVRKKLADEYEVPAYAIFSHKTLKDMAAKVPQNASEFRQVHGVGEVKAESYGPRFLRAIVEWGGVHPQYDRVASFAEHGILLMEMPSTRKSPVVRWAPPVPIIRYEKE